MESYYVNQAGSGLPLQTFSGYRFQKGYGLFGRIFATKILPILRYLGQMGLETGKEILQDVSDSTKLRVRDSIKKVANEITNTQKSQGGDGLLKLTKKKSHKRVSNHKHKSIFPYDKKDNRIQKKVFSF